MTVRPKLSLTHKKKSLSVAIYGQSHTTHPNENTFVSPFSKQIRRLAYFLSWMMVWVKAQARGILSFDANLVGNGFLQWSIFIYTYFRVLCFHDRCLLRTPKCALYKYVFFTVCISSLLLSRNAQWHRKKATFNPGLKICVTRI